MTNVCEYCNASNPNKEKNCVACGAPLSKIKPVAKKPKSTKPVSAEISDHSIETAEKIANLASSIWLAVFDAIIIAAVSLAIGLAGGVVEQPVLGVADFPVAKLGLCGDADPVFLLPDVQRRSCWDK